MTDIDRAAPYLHEPLVFDEHVRDAETPVVQLHTVISGVELPQGLLLLEQEPAHGDLINIKIPMIAGTRQFRIELVQRQFSPHAENFFEVFLEEV